MQQARWGLLIGVAIALGGCGTMQPSNTQSAAAPKPTITLRFSGWQSNPNEGKLLQQVIQQFEAEHPHIEVQYEAINSEYMDVIRTRLIGDVAPDVFYLDAFEAPQLIKYGVLEPLDQYIPATFDLADFEPTLLSAFQHNGNLYGLPKDFSTLALFYNKQAFARAGITQPPHTWEALRQFSQRLTIDTNGDRTPDQFGLGIAPELARQTFMIRAFGGQLQDQQGKAMFASPASLQGLNLVVEQYRRDRTAAQPTDVGTSSGSEMLGQGKAAMVIEGPWAIPYLRETFPALPFGTAAVPTVNGKQSTMTYTVAYVMNRQTQHKQAAWSLIAYLTSKRGMKTWAQQGLVLPSRRSLLADLGYQTHPLYAPFVRGAAYGTTWQAADTLPILRTHFNNQFISALLGEQSLTQAMQRAQDAANREIYWSRSE
ncbi:MAG: ABC transporter substrate-binding protein [Leptolyngbyaceae cyanobacterium bins.349]|nr:ABC transporter substrate-binding protein [Leptolyngbyaceae cyanobacterium bins.349]